jgi:DNA-binding LacI/PurR family transcriptional regulator
MANINDVASLAGVSKSTVSNVFNNREKVCQSTISKVELACKELGYFPSFAASSLVTRKTGIFGLFIGTNDAPFEPEVCNPLIESLVTSSVAKDMHLLIYYSVTRAKIKHILSGKGPIDGAVILTPIKDDFRIEELTSNMINTVIIGKPSGSTPAAIPYVDEDNEEMVYDITSKLIAMGRRQFLFICSRADYSISQERCAGFYRALKEHEIDIDDCMVSNISGNTEEVKSLSKMFLKTHQDKPAILTVFGNENEIRAECNHSNVVIFDWRHVRYNMKQLGNKAFDLLYRSLNGDAGVKSEIVPYIIDWESFLSDNENNK